MAPIIRLALLVLLFIWLSLAMPMRLMGAVWSLARHPMTPHCCVSHHAASSDDFLGRYGHAWMFARRSPSALFFFLESPSARQTTTPPPADRKEEPVRDADGGPRPASLRDIDNVASDVEGALRFSPLFLPSTCVRVAAAQASSRTCSTTCNCTGWATYVLSSIGYSIPRPPIRFPTGFESMSCTALRFSAAHSSKLTGRPLSVTPSAYCATCTTAAHIEEVYR